MHHQILLMYNITVFLKHKHKIIISFIFYPHQTSLLYMISIFFRKPNDFAFETSTVLYQHL
ncbi:hypothetical protein X975_05182, partial [Stegodyphus mimosarum]